MTKTDECREAFEKWWQMRFKCEPTSTHWEVWQAAYSAPKADAVMGEWLPIAKGYIDAPVYLCYFPNESGVNKYKAHGLLSVAKSKGATHYWIPTPPTQNRKDL